jgi:hypothetical protein
MRLLELYAAPTASTDGGLSRPPRGAVWPLRMLVSWPRRGSGCGEQLGGWMWEMRGGQRVGRRGRATKRAVELRASVMGVYHHLPNLDLGRRPPGSAYRDGSSTRL